MDQLIERETFNSKFVSFESCQGRFLKKLLMGFFNYPNSIFSIFLAWPLGLGEKGGGLFMLI